MRRAARAGPKNYPLRAGREEWGLERSEDRGIPTVYPRLLEFLAGERRLQRAYAYLGVAPDDENSHSFITWLSRNGFRVRTKLLRR